MKTVAVSEDTWKKLKELKKKIGVQSINEVINALIEAWHLKALKDELSKIDLKISYNDIREFISTIRAFGKRSEQVTEVRGN
ncbi:MAG: hypothetical protein QXH78_02600 [Desulfurococcaceae archaeon]